MKSGWKLVVASLAVFLISIVASTVWWGNRVVRGYETDPAQQAVYLGKVLSRELDYADLRHAWVKRSWANGFADHTYLFFLEIAEPARGEFWGILEAGCRKKSDPDFDVAGYFDGGGYLGPSDAPNWWDTKALERPPSLFLATGQRNLRFTRTDDGIYIVLSDG